MTKLYKIAVIEGDGIGHEIVPQALEVAKSAAKKNGFIIDPSFFPFWSRILPGSWRFYAKGWIRNFKKI